MAGVYAITPAGPQLDVPHDVTPAQLEALLNGLLQNEDKLPYSFFIEDTELAAELGQHLMKHKVRWVQYRPAVLLCSTIMQYLYSHLTA